MTSERKFVTENIRRYLLKEFLMKETKRAGFGGLDIQRTPMGTRVTLLIERPGLVIGRGGGTINALTQAVSEEFQFSNPQIEVQEVRNPSLNAQIMAEKLASALERGWHFRRAGHSTVRRIMDAGARGSQVIISGKLTGQRHRVEKFKEGHIKYCGEPAIQWMEEGTAVAKRKLGVIGVKVQIMNPKARLPDDVEVISEIPAVTEEVEEAEAETTEGEEIKKQEAEKDKKKVEKKAVVEEDLDKKLKHLTKEIKEVEEDIDISVEKELDKAGLVESDRQKVTETVEIGPKEGRKKEDITIKVKDKENVKPEENVEKKTKDDDKKLENKEKAEDVKKDESDKS